jgi:hypothetical protein
VVVEAQAPVGSADDSIWNKYGQTWTDMDRSARIAKTELVFLMYIGTGGVETSLSAMKGSSRCFVKRENLEASKNERVR